MIDVEPLFIEADSKKWVHPHVFTLAAMQEDTECLQLTSTRQLFRAYLEDGGKTTYVVFRSKSLARSLKEALGGGWKVDLDALKTALWITLREDVWVPGKVQFCEYPIYRELEHLTLEFKISFLSADVVLVLQDGQFTFES